jgi:hypothetical protein
LLFIAIEFLIFLSGKSEFFARRLAQLRESQRKTRFDPQNSVVEAFSTPVS